MNSLELKRGILEAGKKKMGAVVKDFEERIKDLKDVTIGDAGLEIASQNEARKDADLELMGTMANQLEFATMELETLNRINADEIHTAVDFGSVVITDKRNLFVSTGIEEFEYDGKKYIGLSTQAPLYKNMAGCKVGDKVSFHGIEYHIKEIF